LWTGAAVVDAVVVIVSVVVIVAEETCTSDNLLKLARHLYLWTGAGLVIGIISSVIVIVAKKTCNSYNLLKLARHLHLWTGSGELADYLERNHLNAVMGTQRGAGEFLYTTPLGYGVSKARSGHGWGDPRMAFWCCYGTAVESFARLQEGVFHRSPAGAVLPVGALADTLRRMEAGLNTSAFTETLAHPTIFVNQWVSAEVTWPEAGIRVIMEANYLPPSGEPAVAGNDGPQLFSTARLQVSWMEAVHGAGAATAEEEAGGFDNKGGFPGGGEGSTGGIPQGGSPSVAIRLRIPKWAQAGGGGAPVVLLGGKDLRQVDPNRWHCGAGGGAASPLDDGRTHYCEVVFTRRVGEGGREAGGGGGGGGAAAAECEG
jgi:hypothetical protein